MNDKIEKAFLLAGFSEKETRVYMALLGEDFLTVTEVAERATQKRSIVYVILDELVAKGYVIKKSKAKIKKFRAANPEIVLADLKLASSTFSSLMPYFSGLYEKSKGKSGITTIEDSQKIKDYYQSISTNDSLYAISSFSQLEKHFPDVMSNWIDDIRLGKFNSKSFKQILVQNRDEGKNKKLYEELGNAGVAVKILTADKSAEKVDILLTKSSMTITSLGGAPYMIIVDSKEIAAAFVALFNILWNISNN